MAAAAIHHTRSRSSAGGAGRASAVFTGVDFRVL